MTNQTVLSGYIPSPNVPSIKHHWRPASWLHVRKAERPTVSWTRCFALKQMTMTRFFNCQSDTANAIWHCSWRARNIVSVTKREGICSWERHFRKGLHLSHHLWQRVCLSTRKLSGRASAKHFREVLRSADRCWPDSLPREVKGKVPFLWAEDWSLDGNSWT